MMPESWATSEATRRSMLGNKRRDTRTELAVRRELHALGLRYRVDYPLPSMPRRRADVAFTRQRIAVFIDGCFWHGCPAHGTAPKRNGEYWSAKIDANRKRDADTDIRLRAEGWESMRFWEHEPPVEVAQRILRRVREGS